MKRANWKRNETMSGTRVDYAWDSDSRGTGLAKPERNDDMRWTQNKVAPVWVDKEARDVVGSGFGFNIGATNER